MAHCRQVLGHHLFHIFRRSQAGTIMNVRSERFAYNVAFWAAYTGVNLRFSQLKSNLHARRNRRNSSTPQPGEVRRFLTFTIRPFLAFAKLHLLEREATYIHELAVHGVLVYTSEILIEERNDWRTALYQYFVVSNSCGGILWKCLELLIGWRIVVDTKRQSEALE